MKYTAVLFDLYGTLVRLPTKRIDPMISLIGDLTNKNTLKPELDSGKIRRIAMTERFLDLSDFARRIMKADHKSEDLTQYELELKLHISEANCFDETEEVLQQLKRRGIKLGLVSNLAFAYGEVVKTLGIEEFFDAIVFSYEIGAIKPEEEIYKRALYLLGVNAQETFMTGDKIKNDVEGPKRLGISAVLLDRENKEREGEKIRDLRELAQRLSKE